MITSPVRVRFAPSPTGHLHIGGLRTALFNWLLARHYGGVYLLRIEDTDVERSKQEYLTSIMDSFSWCNLMPDGPVVIQSRNIEHHRAVALQLVQEGKAYRCYCTPEMVAERYHERFGAMLEYGKYDGYCRDRAGDLANSHVIRFALPTDCAFVEFDDLIRGTVTIQVDQLDDFVLIRSDGMPTYNFAVVVDDADMRITHVVRGEDHIPNTPKQILLYQACHFKLPVFGHLSMILGPTGQRLSKRDGATSVIEYRQAGYLPDALLNYLARLGWAHGDQEIFSRDELIKFFSVEHINKKSAVFDPAKLSWTNGVHMRAMTVQQILAYLDENQMREMFAPWSQEQIVQLIALYQERVTTLRELTHELALLYTGPFTITPEDKAAWLTPQTNELLMLLCHSLANISPFSVDLVTVAVKDLCRQHNIKLVQLAQPIRLALVGKTMSPGVFELMSVLGQSKTIERIQKLVG